MNKAKLNYAWYKLACVVGNKLSSWYGILAKYVRAPRERMHFVMIPMEKKIEQPSQKFVPMDIVDAFIDKAGSLAVMKECMCRVGGNCKDYPHDVACLGMGSSLKDMDPSFGTIVNKEEAKAHVKRALGEGLYPLISHYERDAMMLSLDFDKLMLVCFCCPCHCVARRSGKLSDGLENSFHSNAQKLPSVQILFDEDKCNACGKCVDECFANAITLENDAINLDQDKCKGCGRCAMICDAFSVTYDIKDVDRMAEELGFAADIT